MKQENLELEFNISEDMMDIFSNYQDISIANVFQSILNNQDTAFVIRDANFTPVYANPSFFKLFSTTYEVWKQDDWSQHFSPDSLAIILNEAIPQAISGKKWRGSLEIVTDNQETKLVTVEWNGVFDGNGKASYFYGFYNELSSIRYFESELQKQNDFLNEIIDTLPDPLTVKTKDHIWVAVNKAFCKLTGRTRQELLGKNDYDFFPKEEADVFWKQDDIAMATNKEIANEEYLSHKNGEKRLLSRKRVAITRSDGEKILISIGRDISNDRQLKKSFASSYIQLEAGLNALKHDLFGLRHSLESGFSRAEAIRGLLEKCNDEFSSYIKETGLKSDLVQNNEKSPAKLSSREYQVLMLLVQGRRIKEIAEHLDISANTASTYRSRIMKKLNISSLSDLIHYAMRFGLK